MLATEVRQAAADEDDLQHFVMTTRLSVGNPQPLWGFGAIHISLRAMVASLDPYCAFYTGAEALGQERAPVTEGFGLELLDSAAIGPLIVKSVMLGSPAQKAGLRPGDQLMKIDGRTAGNRAILPTQGQVKLTVLRPGDVGNRTINLQAELLQPETVLGVRRADDNSWDFFLDRENRIAQVRLASLDIHTPKELAEALVRLRETKMRGLILDLRWCPGGYLDPSRFVAEMFLGDYSLPFFMLPTPHNWLAQADPYLDNHRMTATVRYRSGQVDEHHDRPETVFTDCPMVVLVNGETSGGAELIAAVLQDNKRALVAGQRTRGKATVQTIVSLSSANLRRSIDIGLPNSTLKFSTGMLLRPSGKNLDRFANSRPNDDWGVQPDPQLATPISPRLDRQLHTWWRWQDLRPGTSSESLPLDDPAADPLRLAALHWLQQALQATQHQTNPTSPER
jgi:carboxyl-terminal processing protease